MFAVKGIKTGLGLAALFALLVSGLALVATGGAASASTTPGHTIATAGTLNIGGDTASGGGGRTDFWKVRLNGGDRVSIDIDEAGVVAAVFDFQRSREGPEVLGPRLRHLRRHPDRPGDDLRRQEDRVHDQAVQGPGELLHPG
jgi:hypothetical protein